MKRTLMLLSTMVVAVLLAGGLALVAVSPAARADVDCLPSGSVVVCTFTYTGAAQSWTVPEGVTQATFDVYGAEGGREPIGGRIGGGGALAHATIDVTPDDTLQVNVGGGGAEGTSNGAVSAGGFNGGADSGIGTNTGGGGGGASDIRTGHFALADRIIVAGGGGGAGADNGAAGGAGGGIVGGNGGAAAGGISNGQGGLGGSDSSGGDGGAAGPPVTGRAICSAGDNGTLGVGGVGGGCSGELSASGGGGGGGYYGGGGGGGAVQAGGGGGGSGFVDPQASDVQFQTSVRGGNGLVTITYTPPDTAPPTLTVSHTGANANGWNKTSPVTLNISASDSGSGLAGAPTCKDGTTDLTLTAGTAGNWTASVSGEGTHTISCSVSDNAEHSTSATDTVKIDTSAPTLSVSHTGANANGWNKTPQVSLTVTASDSGSSGMAADPTCTDGSTALSLTPGSTAGTWTASVSGEGTHAIECTVTDNADNSASATDTVKIDTKAPSASCSVSPSRLRTSANNHKLVTITATVQVSDSSGGSGPNGFKLVSVASNQAPSGLGTGDVPNDIQGWTTGTNDTSGQLRVERYGGARVYTLTYQGEDVAGNTSSNCLATVTVPKGD
jgi:hypothetical protein